MTILSLDFETCSEVDLRKVGASRYAADPSTFVTVAAWAFDDDEVDSLSHPTGLTFQRLPAEVQEHILGGGLIRAWNAWFEFSILTKTFGLRVWPEQMRCTQEQAMHAGLPARLEAAGPALGLNIVKDPDARDLMLRCAKPRSIDPFGVRSYWTTVPGKLMDLEIYCRGDVAAERAIAKQVPPLPPQEQELSILNRRSNARGILIDLELCKRMLVLAQIETYALNSRCEQLTWGVVTSPGTQSERLIIWFKAHGVKLPDVRRNTILETMETGPDADIPELPLQVLGIRRMVSKSSMRKLQTMLRAVEADGRIRGSLQYYGASRTGRFAGRLIQPQNFPRPFGDPTLLILGVLKGLKNEDLRVIHGEQLLAALSSALRGTLIPGYGLFFAAIDLAQIEARITAWLGNEARLLTAFRDGEDVYSVTAKDLGLPTRQAGKACVLGLGFGQGFERFVFFAGTYGVVLSRMESLKIVLDWRAQNPGIVKAWYELDDKIRWAITNWSRSPGRYLKAKVLDGRVTIQVSAARNQQPLLTLKLPSGRKLYYRNPRLVRDSDPLKPDRLVIFYDGVDQKTGQWGPVRSWGSKFFENLVQAMARDVIFEAALKIDRNHLGALAFSVHDELVFEVSREDPQGTFKKIQAIVDTPPDWAKGLPLASSGGILARYGK